MPLILNGTTPKNIINFFNCHVLEKHEYGPVSTIKRPIYASYLYELTGQVVSAILLSKQCVHCGHISYEISSSEVESEMDKYDNENTKTIV